MTTIRCEPEQLLLLSLQLCRYVALPAKQPASLPACLPACQPACRTEGRACRLAINEALMTEQQKARSEEGGAIWCTLTDLMRRRFESNCKAVLLERFAHQTLTRERPKEKPVSRLATRESAGEAGRRSTRDWPVVPPTSEQQEC